MHSLANQNELSIKAIKNWDDARKLLRKWRDENIRNSKDILTLWDQIVCSSINKFGDEKWLVYEQVYIAALDCHNLLVATNCIGALKTQYPKSTRVLKLMAMKFEATEQYDKALDRYEKILELDETNAYVRKRKIACLKAQNKIKEYIHELNDYLKMFQSDHEAWLELCEAYLNEMEYAKAAFCLEELILIFPHNHVYHQRYADIKYTQGKYDEAQSYYSYALKLNPNNVRALYGLVLTTANLKNIQKSKEVSETSKLSNWANEQLLKKHQEKHCNDESINSLNNLLKCVSISKN